MHCFCIFWCRCGCPASQPALSSHLLDFSCSVAGDALAGNEHVGVPSRAGGEVKTAVYQNIGRPRAKPKRLGSRRRNREKLQNLPHREEGRRVCRTTLSAVWLGVTQPISRTIREISNIFNHLFVPSTKT